MGVVCMLLCVQMGNAYAAIAVTNAWIREVPPQSPVAAAFMALTNDSQSADRIVAMSSPLAGRWYFIKQVPRCLLADVLHHFQTET